MKIDPFPGTLTKQLVDIPYVTKNGKQAFNRTLKYVLSPEQREWLVKWFPEEENSRLMQACGISLPTLYRFARELHLTKSEAGWRRIRKRKAAHVKRLCEKNGYYDSLRGRRPSEACIAGTMKRWQEVREGKKEDPVTLLKKNKRKYNKWLQRVTEGRRETLKKDIRRAVYGLPRKTKLNIVLKPYTSSQSNHRYNAVKRGYYVMEDCSEAGGERYNIYYDTETQRSEKFEKNLIKDGFVLREWTD